MSLTATCPSCSKTYPVKPEMAGKSAKCKCGTKFKIPQRQEDVLTEADLLDDIPTLASAGNGGIDMLSASDLLEEAPPPRPAISSPFDTPAAAPPPLPTAGISAAPPVLLAQCRGCRSPLADGAVICTRCGMNQRTGQKMLTTVAAAPRPIAQPAPTYAPRRSVFGGGRSGGLNIVIGIILIVLGIGITAATMSDAGGGRIMIGLVFVGGWRLIRGIIQMMSGE